MKKLIALLLLICLMPLCAWAETAACSDVVIPMEGAEVVFTPVKNSHLLTRESTEEEFEQLGQEYWDLIPWMDQYDVYALLFDADMTTEFQIIATETNKPSIEELTEAQEKRLFEERQYYYSGYHYTVTSAEFYQSPEGHKYIRVVAYYPLNGRKVYSVEYFTRYAGYEVSVFLLPYEDEVIQEHWDMAQALADSLRIRAVE